MKPEGNLELCAHEHYVNVGPQPDVVGEIPARMIGIIIDDDLIRIPEPVVAEGEIIGSNAEIETTEPEAAGAPTGESPPVLRAQAGSEVSVFPGMIDVVVGIVSSASVSDPLSVRMHVRSLGVPGLVAESSVLVFLVTTFLVTAFGVSGMWRFRVCRLRPPFRNVALHPAFRMLLVLWFIPLRKRKDRKNQRHQHHSKDLSHPQPPISVTNRP